MTRKHEMFVKKQNIISKRKALPFPHAFILFFFPCFLLLLLRVKVVTNYK